MHLNADWVILEPVDSRMQPVPPGVRSHTVLLTNLANFAQPIIRYDLGDSITIVPEQCSCGSPFPLIRVEGRRDDVIRLTAEDGAQVPLLPLAVVTVLEEEGRVSRFQLIQTGPATLSLRMDSPFRQHTVWHRAEAALQRYFASQGLDHIHITRDPRPPEAEPRSGKCRQVIAQHHMAF